jgi:hypothetical protein
MSKKSSSFDEGGYFYVKDQGTPKTSNMSPEEEEQPIDRSLKDSGFIEQIQFLTITIREPHIDQMWLKQFKHKYP